MSSGIKVGLTLTAIARNLRAARFETQRSFILPRGTYEHIGTISPQNPYRTVVLPRDFTLYPLTLGLAASTVGGQRGLIEVTIQRHFAALTAEADFTGREITFEVEETTPICILGADGNKMIDLIDRINLAIKPSNIRLRIPEAEPVNLAVCLPLYDQDVAGLSFILTANHGLPLERSKRINGLLNIELDTSNFQLKHSVIICGPDLDPFKGLWSVARKNSFERVFFNLLLEAVPVTKNKRSHVPSGVLKAPGVMI